MSDQQMLKEINDAMGAHGAWKLRLSTAIRTGSFDGDPKAVSCDDQCAFGKWLIGPSIRPEVREGMPWQVVKRLHADFHRQAGRVASLVVLGNTKDAAALMAGDYLAASEKLSRALTKWRKELMTATALSAPGARKYG